MDTFRHHNDSWAITIVPRFLTALVKEGEYPLGRQVWDDTSIMIPAGAPTTWQEAIAAQFISGKYNLLIGDILRYFPVALLTSKENQ